MTVGQQGGMMTPPCAVWSPRRAANRPPIITVVEPFTIRSGGPTQMHWSVTRAAGRKPISTCGQPGATIGPPTCGTTPVTIGHVCMSVSLAAGGIRLFVPTSLRLRIQRSILLLQRVLDELKAQQRD